MASRLHALQSHWQRLLELGYRPYGAAKADAVARRRIASRGFMTYESDLWLRPPHCSGRSMSRTPAGVIDVPPGTCEPNGTVCDKYRISHKFRFVWHHVWKGGTTSLSPYLTCNFGAEPVAGLLLTEPRSGRRGQYLHVGTAREPFRRFISAFQEVYLRVRVRRRAAHPTLSSASTSRNPAATRGGGAAAWSSLPTTTKCHHRNVPWMLVAMSRTERPHAHACADALIAHELAQPGERAAAIAAYSHVKARLWAYDWLTQLGLR